MTNKIQSIAIDKLVAHPGNPNRQSRANFAKLVRNIELSGRYEPLIVRQKPEVGRQKTEGRASSESDGPIYQIINGHHRWRALAKLGYNRADCIIWDIDDEQTDILLATLNRLGGRDELAKKLVLLKRLNKRLGSGELAKLLPQTKKQIERLNSMLDALRRTPNGGYSILDRSKSQGQNRQAGIFANPMVFFVSDTQQRVIEDALSLARENLGRRGTMEDGREMKHETKAAKRAAALTYIAQYFLDNPKQNQGQRKKTSHKATNNPWSSQ